MADLFLALPPCPGPLVWFEAGETDCHACGGTAYMSVAECATCGYIVTTGNYHDNAHEDTPLTRGCP